MVVHLKDYGFSAAIDLCAIDESIGKKWQYWDPVTSHYKKGLEVSKSQVKKILKMICRYADGDTLDEVFEFMKEHPKMKEIWDEVRK